MKLVKLCVFPIRGVWSFSSLPPQKEINPAGPVGSGWLRSTSVLLTSPAAAAAQIGSVLLRYDIIRLVDHGEQILDARGVKMSPLNLDFNTCTAAPCQI